MVRINQLSYVIIFILFSLKAYLRIEILVCLKKIFNSFGKPLMKIKNSQRVKSSITTSALVS